MAQSLFLPEVKLEYKNLQVGTFNFNYQRSQKEIPLRYFYTGVYLNSYANLFKWVGNVEFPLVDKIDFRYHKKWKTCTFNFEYQFKNRLKDYVVLIQTNTIQRTSLVKMNKNAGEENGVEFRIEKTFLRNKLSLIFKNSLQWNRYLNRTNEVFNYVKNNFKNFNLSIKSRFKENYNFELYQNYRLSAYDNYFSSHRYRFYGVGGSLDIHPLEKLKIQGDFSLNKDFVSKGGLS